MKVASCELGLTNCEDPSGEVDKAISAFGTGSIRWRSWMDSFANIVKQSQSYHQDHFAGAHEWIRRQLPPRPMTVSVHFNRVCFYGFGKFFYILSGIFWDIKSQSIGLNSFYNQGLILNLDFPNVIKMNTLVKSVFQFYSHSIFWPIHVIRF